MKVVFAHDHWFIKTSAGFHSSGGLPEEVLQRYVTAFGSLQIICRSRVEAAAVLPPIVDKRISFAPVVNLRSISGILAFPLVLLDIRRKVAAADVVIARLPSTIGLMAAQEAQRLGIPCLIEVVGHAKDASLKHGSLKVMIGGLIEHLLMRRVIRQASHAIYVTEQYLQRTYPCNGEKFTCSNVNLTSAPVGHYRLTNNGASRVIGIIGSLDVDYKGVDTAIRVLELLIKNYQLPGVRLEHVGAGNRARWQRLAEELGVGQHIQFIGSLPPGPAVIEWMDGIDLLLHPSRTEGLPRSIIEAMSRARPVVASSVGGIPELLEHDLIFAPTDYEGMAMACYKILTDTQYAATQMKRNVQVSAQFQADVLSARRKIVLEKLKGIALTRSEASKCN